MRFERINIVKLCEKYNLSYMYFDVLRQTTIERIVNNQQDTTKQELINLLLTNIKYLLEISIKETTQQWQHNHLLNIFWLLV